MFGHKYHQTEVFHNGRLSLDAFKVPIDRDAVFLIFGRLHALDKTASLSVYFESPVYKELTAELIIIQHSLFARLKDVIRAMFCSKATDVRFVGLFCL